MKCPNPNCEAILETADQILECDECGEKGCQLCFAEENVCSECNISEDDDDFDLDGSDDDGEGEED